MSDEIVGHKTFSTGDPLHPFRHEPLTRSEAAAILAAVDAAKAKRAADMPTDQDAVNALWSAQQRLRELGWGIFDLPYHARKSAITCAKQPPQA